MGMLFIVFSVFGISFLSVGLGGIFAFLFKKKNEAAVPMLVLSVSGILLYQIILRLIPESIKSGGILLTFLGVGVGVIAFLLIELLADRIIIITNTAVQNTGMRSSMMIALAVALHNLPAGIALGSVSSNNSILLTDCASIWMNFM
ncbi:hypothetical protein [Paenibacillus typhae]|uniref:Zinc transporter, ZIP family n=1 Tax=Paenibacillus typhae TaxID=1174501 RepID=A0A1G8GKM0_9BACL|nr:hypothetical protein [Paenibacillus typhae]SDH94902.1 zinc transporter, ZIP family [Paenibacillus typhae]